MTVEIKDLPIAIHPLAIQLGEEPYVAFLTKQQISMPARH